MMNSCNYGCDESRRNSIKGQGEVVFFNPFSLSGRFEEKQEEGPDRAPDVVSLCLSDHSCLVRPPAFSAELLP